MQELADDYQRALADISSLRAIYDTEIEGLTEELSQCKAAHGEEFSTVVWIDQCLALGMFGSWMRMFDRCWYCL